MVEPTLTNIARPVASGIDAPKASQSGASSSTGESVAFRALLERLEREAHALEEDARSISDPKALAGAVDRAQASLQDALSIGDQLLDAYREACSRRGAGGASPVSPESALSPTPSDRDRPQSLLRARR